MNKLLTTLLVVLTLTACQDGSIKHSNYKPDIKIYQVQGKSLECIGDGYQMSCNWDKYNKLEANE